MRRERNRWAGKWELWGRQDTNNSPAFSKPKCKSCQEDQGHDCCQDDPAIGAAMICGGGCTQGCPPKPTHCLAAFPCFSFVIQISASTISSLLVSSLIPPQSDSIETYHFLIPAGLSFLTLVFLIFIPFGCGVSRIPNFSPGSPALPKNHLFPSQWGPSSSSPQ